MYKNSRIPRFLAALASLLPSAFGQVTPNHILFR